MAYLIASLLALAFGPFLAIWAQVDTQRTQAGSWHSVSVFEVMR